MEISEELRASMMDEIKFGKEMRSLGKKYNLRRDTLEKMISEIGLISLEQKKEKGVDHQQIFLFTQYRLFKELLSADQSRLRDQMREPKPQHLPKSARKKR